MTVPADAQLAGLWPKPNLATRLILVRHGETDWNAQRRFQGHLDIGLNAKGIEQARLLAARLDALEETLGRVIQACVSSDLGRAYHTAQLLNTNRQLDIEQSEQWRERHYGEFSGLTSGQMQAQNPQEFHGLQNRIPQALITGGESLEQFNHRILKALHHLIVKYSQRTVLVIAHGGVLDCIYRTAKAEPLQKHRDWLLPNCALNIIDFTDLKNAQVHLWANLDHFPDNSMNKNVDEVDGNVA